MGAVPIRRDLDVARVERALVDASPAVLLLHGEPGAGTSSVLTAMAERAPGRVLSATAVRAETDLPFSTLHLLLHAVLQEAQGLSPVARSALEVAFGRTDGPPPPRMVLRHAVLDALALTRGTAGLLVLLDDVQWMDPASAEVLAYVVRRLPNGVAALVAGWDHAAPDGPFDALGLPSFTLRSLGGQRTRGAGRGPVVRLELDGTDPLSLVEPHRSVPARWGGTLPSLRQDGAADPADPFGLTPQEREIADLAATGLTNREIGERLHLSPRTVGSHLYRVFPKLGVRTRAGLRDALTRSVEVLQPSE